MSIPTDTEMDLLIARARITELEQHQREDVAMIRHAAESLGQATIVIRRYQVVFHAARTFQERFGACAASYDADGDPTETTEELSDVVHIAAQALWEALNAFEIPTREEVAHG